MHKLCRSAPNSRHTVMLSFNRSLINPHRWCTQQDTNSLINPHSTLALENVMQLWGALSRPRSTSDMRRWQVRPFSLRASNLINAQKVEKKDKGNHENTEENARQYGIERARQHSGKIKSEKHKHKTSWEPQREFVMESNDGSCVSTERGDFLPRGKAASGRVIVTLDRLDSQC